MERLTYTNKSNGISVPRKLVYDINMDRTNFAHLEEIVKKLAYYENLGESGRLKIFPCDIGDTVYIIGKCKDFPPKLDGTMWDSDGGFGTATGYYCPYENSDLCPFEELEDCSFAEDKFGIFEDVVCHICIEEDETWYVCENSNGYENKDFGESIFTTREDAELKLKEMKK